MAPQQKTRGRVIRQAVELLDIYPTLTELCGLPKPDGLAGQSLARQLNQPEPVKNFALSQFPRPVNYNFKSAPPKSMGYSIRDDRYRLTQWIDFANGKVLAEEFYNYTLPWPESKNLIDHPQSTTPVARLRLKLEAFVKARP